MCITRNEMDLSSSIVKHQHIGMMYHYVFYFVIFD